MYSIIGANGYLGSYIKKIILEEAGAKFVPNKDGKGCYYEFADGVKYDSTKSLKENLSRNRNNKQ